MIYLQDVLDGWLGAGQGARHPADHRSLRRAPRRARLVRHRLPATAPTRDTRGREAQGACRASRSVLAQRRGREALRAAARPHRRPRRRLRRSTSCIGTSAARHDLSGLDAPLRSHGGISEQTRAAALQPHAAAASTRSRRLRNFDIFDLALNHARMRRWPDTERGAEAEPVRHEALRIAGEKVSATA